MYYSDSVLKNLSNKTDLNSLTRIVQKYCTKTTNSISDYQVFDHSSQPHKDWAYIYYSRRPQTGPLWPPSGTGPPPGRTAPVAAWGRSPGRTGRRPVSMLPAGHRPPSGTGFCPQADSGVCSTPGRVPGWVSGRVLDTYITRALAPAR